MAWRGVQQLLVLCALAVAAECLKSCERSRGTAFEASTCQACLEIVRNAFEIPASLTAALPEAMRSAAIQAQDDALRAQFVDQYCHRPDLNIGARVRQKCDELLQDIQQTPLALNDLAQLTASDFDLVMQTVPMAALPANAVFTLDSAFASSRRLQFAAVEEGMAAPSIARFVYAVQDSVVDEGQLGREMERAAPVAAKMRGQKFLDLKEMLDINDAQFRTKTTPGSSEVEGYGFLEWDAGAVILNKMGEDMRMFCTAEKCCRDVDQYVNKIDQLIQQTRSQSAILVASYNFSYDAIPVLWFGVVEPKTVAVVSNVTTPTCTTIITSNMPVPGSPRKEKHIVPVLPASLCNGPLQRTDPPFFEANICYFYFLLWLETQSAGQDLRFLAEVSAYSAATPESCQQAANIGAWAESIYDTYLTGKSPQRLTSLLDGAAADFKQTWKNAEEDPQHMYSELVEIVLAQLNANYLPQFLTSVLKSIPPGSDVIPAQSG
eukprot:gnl/Hemi2/12508_TR4262_c0_g1_i1.p1 gnl/Hemi2/12508_TR4262_c0_g1~~gnl/Hemi2/12508_TR4262_c0_g1_i1.p1  ORF type:complete len:492 (+),score=197.41 gnl/Hemi2/12508_TR4262_c0_g1_i1:155-1630(+)